MDARARDTRDHVVFGAWSKLTQTPGGNETQKLPFPIADSHRSPLPPPPPPRTLASPRPRGDPPTVRRLNSAGSGTPTATAMATNRGDDLMLPTSSVPALTPRRSASLRSREAITVVLHSWISRQFLYGAAILFPIAVTMFVMMWVFRFFEDFFSPLYRAIGECVVALVVGWIVDFGSGTKRNNKKKRRSTPFSPPTGLPFFGLGFLTSLAFIFAVGLLGSSWAGSTLLSVGEWVIKRLPLARHVYSAAKQVSTALKPSDASGAGSFRECVLVRHPRRDELMIGFVTGGTCLRFPDGVTSELVGVFVPTNHLYVGDFVLVRAEDVVRTEMSVSAGIECCVSAGMSLPKALTHLNAPVEAGRV